MSVPIRRSYEARINEVLPGERAVVSKINTRRIDRHRSRIEPSGVDFEEYKKNPVVLWEHGQDPTRGRIPIGRNKWIRADQKAGEIVAKTIFRKDDYSEAIFAAYQDESLRGWSIGALERDGGPPTPEERRLDPALAGCDYIYRKSELAEYSATAVPSNPETLTLLVSRGVWVPESALATVVSRYITHSDGKWIVHAENGDVLGTHDNEEDAKKQLAAIEANKHKHDRTMSNTSTAMTVKPAFIAKLGGKFVVFSDENQVISEHDDEAEAKAALAGTTTPARALLSGYTIRCDGHQSWVVHGPDGAPIAGFPDIADAEDLKRAIERPPLRLDQVFAEWHSAAIARQVEREQELLDRLELKITGRV